jgi:hypothetical protein
MRITRCPKGEVLNEPFSPILAPALGARFPLATAGLVVGSSLATGEKAKCREDMKLVLPSLLVVIAGAAHAADTLPKAMLGKWASNAAACNRLIGKRFLHHHPRVYFPRRHQMPKGLPHNRVQNMKELKDKLTKRLLALSTVT